MKGTDRMESWGHRKDLYNGFPLKHKNIKTDIVVKCEIHLYKIDRNIKM